jgi:proline iminopeptidase
MKSYKPKIELYIQVTSIHKIYIAIYGNMYGEEVLILHGGPGFSCTEIPAHLSYHDHDKYKIIIFDQRGCGKSTPSCELKENTTWDIIN